GDQRGLGAVEIFDERGDPALVIHFDLSRLLMTRIGEHQPDARVQERELAEAMLEPVEVEFELLERFGGWQEGHLGAAPVAFANDLERSFGLAVAEAHEMLLAVAP